MTQLGPLRLADKDRSIRDFIEQINALAVQVDGVAALRMGPLERMDERAAIRKLFAKVSEVSVAAGGAPVAWVGPLRDPETAMQMLGVAIATTTVVVENADEGGGGEEYVAQAVYFDGSTWLENAALSCVDSRYVAFSCWVKTAVRGAFFTSDPDDEVNNLFNWGTPSGDPAISANFICELGTHPFVEHIEPSLYLPVLDNSWHHVLMGVDTNQAAGQKILATYLDDVFVAADDMDDDDGTFAAAFNGLKTLIGSDFFHGLNGDMADFRLMVGTNLLSGSTIPEAMRRLFIDAGGKPVDPTIATGALGVPTILLSGDSSGFVTNQGSGGAFTVATGSLTNASTSPSD